MTERFAPGTEKCFSSHKAYEAFSWETGNIIREEKQSREKERERMVESRNRDDEKRPAKKVGHQRATDREQRSNELGRGGREQERGQLWWATPLMGDRKRAGTAGSWWKSPQLVGMDGKGERISTNTWIVLAPKAEQPHSLDGVEKSRWGQRFIEGCDKLNYLFLILTFSLLILTSFVAGGEKHEQKVSR